MSLVISTLSICGLLAGMLLHEFRERAKNLMLLRKRVSGARIAMSASLIRVGWCISEILPLEPCANMKFDSQKYRKCSVR